MSAADGTSANDQLHQPTTMSAADDTGANDTTCTLCLEPPTKVTQLGSTPTSVCCKAVFCRECVLQWVVRRVPTCPACRSSAAYLYDTNGGVPTERRKFLNKYRRTAAKNPIPSTAPWCVAFHRGLNEELYNLMVERKASDFDGATARGIMGVALHDHNALSSYALADLPVHDAWSDMRLLAGDTEILTVEDGNKTVYISCGRCYYDRKLRSSTFSMNWGAFWETVHDRVIPDLYRFYKYLMSTQELSAPIIALFSFMGLSMFLARHWPIDFGSAGEIRAVSAGKVVPGAKSLSVLQFVLLQCFVCEAVANGLDRDWSKKCTTTNAPLLELASIFSKFNWFLFRHGVSNVFQFKRMPALVFHVDGQETDWPVATWLLIPPSKNRGMLAATAAAVLAEDTRSVVSPAYQGVRVGPTLCVHRPLNALAQNPSLVHLLNPAMQVTADEHVMRIVVSTLVVCAQSVGLCIHTSDAACTYYSMRVLSKEAKSLKRTNDHSRRSHHSRSPFTHRKTTAQKTTTGLLSNCTQTLWTKRNRGRRRRRRRRNMHMVAHKNTRAVVPDHHSCCRIYHPTTNAL
jgi:hypothetical protein